MDEEVLAERREHVLVLTLHRPKRLNAMTPSMHRRYRELLADAEADRTVRAVVVTGAGHGFCSGADADAVDQVRARSARPRPSDGSNDARPGYGSHAAFDRPFLYHLGLRLPVVAAVNGPTAGLGFVLACCCDVRFAAEGAFLTSAFGTLGLPVEYGLSWLLPRLIGGARANELLLSCRRIDATEARTIGLVHRVAPAQELLGAAVAYAQALADRCGPEAVANTKRQLYTDWMADLAQSFDDALVLTDVATGSAEFREGVAAMRERRAARWPVS